MKHLKYIKSALVLIAAILSLVAEGQIKTVVGKITTFDSIPLIGAEVKAKGTKQTVLTDSTGYFSVQSNWNDKLRISADGFYDQNVDIGEKVRVVAVNLKPKQGKKERKYDIGYGEVSEKNRTSAVSNLNDDDTNFTRYKDMYDLIQGNFAGVQVQNGEVIIRGTRSFNSGNGALIVVDGVINESDILRVLRPINIKSINIIKDGSTAVYGSQGANGVVLIETKNGT